MCGWLVRGLVRGAVDGEGERERKEGEGRWGMR